MIIQKVNHLDQSTLDEIVSLHYSVLSESFLNNFGKEFLKIFYRSLVEDKKNYFLIVKEGAKTLGFLSATLDSKKTNNEIINKNFLKFTTSILKKSIKNPLLLLRIIYWKIQENNQKDIKPELQFLAIDPSHQGQGLGTKLVKTLNDIFKKRGVNKYGVRTKADNLLSNNFYKKLGLNKIYREKYFGEDFNYYVFKISNPKKSLKIIIDHQPKVNFKYPILISILFFLIFIFKSNYIMATIPFYDFDEAHRAENAKRMAQFHSFFVPLTGSAFDRINHLRIQSKESPFKFLYYHLERPFLVYLTMIWSISVFGQSEWAYRLPSFIFGMLTIFIFVLFSLKFNIGKSKNPRIISLIIGLLSIITSSDLWLSSEYAQMDTGLMFFLNLSLLSLFYYLHKNNKFFLYLTGIGYALAILSKGQPAIIYIFPLFFLIITKKLRLKDLLIFILTSTLILIPWVVYLIYKFSFLDFYQAFGGFALTSASIIYIHQAAPIFWYVRWLWESLRPGWSLFLVFFIFDLLNNRLDWVRKSLLVYIFFGLAAFSIPINKIWWYILPMIPSICFYIYLSISQYIETFPEKKTNVYLAVLIASLPILIQTTNTLSLIYGLIAVVTLVFILNLPSIHIKNVNKNSLIFLNLALTLSLTFFYFRFPEIVPYHKNTKEVANFYKNLPENKCLWAYDMPTEAALFYSDAGEIEIYQPNRVKVYQHCKNYLISPEELPVELSNHKILFQRGRMKLLEI